MGIYKLKNSKNYWMRKSINGKKYCKSTETASKMRANAVYEEWVPELKENVKNGEPVITKVKQEPKPAAMTFYELAERYLEFTSGRLKSYKSLKSRFVYLKKYFGDKPLDDFTVSDLEKIQADILSKGQSIAYANRLVVAIKTAFNKAVDWELMSEDVVKKLKRCKLLKGETKRLRYLSEEESERLLSNCDAHLKPFIATALNTGMRKSEILRLTWDRVDMANKVILLDTTKNGERREIPINNPLYLTLSSLTRHLKTDYVFYNPETLKPYYDFKKPFLRALSKSHILDFVFHDLRHTFASQLVMGGVDLATIQKLLGHKDIKMTLRYAHLSNIHLKDAVNVLDSQRKTTIFQKGIEKV